MEDSLIQREERSYGEEKACDQHRPEGCLGRYICTGDDQVDDCDSNYAIPEFIDSIYYDMSNELEAMKRLGMSNDDNDVGQVVPEDVCLTSFQNEPVWRCNVILAPAPAPHTFLDAVDKPAEYLANVSKEVQLLSTDKLTSIVFSPMSSPKPNHAPDIPLLLMPTHFEAVEWQLSELILEIDAFLTDLSGLSYVKQPFQWTLIYVNGPSHCKAQLNVYAGYSSGYLIEANKLHGDTALFRSLFSQFKAEITKCSEQAEYDSFTVFAPAPMPICILSDCADVGGLGPIFRMAQSPFIDSQIEASRTLCELSADETIRVSLCQLGCLEIIRQLLSGTTSEWVKNHAAIVLANLSDSWECHQYIIDANILPSLLALGTGQDYESKESRVLAVYVIANLSASCAHAVIACLGQKAIQLWFQQIYQKSTSSETTAVVGIPSIMTTVADDRFLLHAQRALVSLTSLLYDSSTTTNNNNNSNSGKSTTSSVCANY